MALSFKNLIFRAITDADGKTKDSTLSIVEMDNNFKVLKDAIKETYARPLIESPDLIQQQFADGDVLKWDATEGRFVAAKDKEGTPGDGTVTVNNGVATVTTDTTVVAEHNGVIFNAYQPVVLTLSDTLPAKGTFLAFHNKMASETESSPQRITLKGSGVITFVNSDGSAPAAGDIVLKPGKWGWIDSTNTDHVFELLGEWEVIPPPPAVTKRILIDFGRSDGWTEGGQLYWNNLTSFADGASIPDLKDVNGVNTRVSLVIPSGKNLQASTSLNQGYSSAIGDYPLAAVNDFCYYNDVDNSGLWKAFELSGFDAPVTIKFLASRNETGNRRGMYRANGGTAIERDAYNNGIVDKLANIALVNGNVTFEMIGAVPGADAAFLNLMEITW